MGFLPDTFNNCSTVKQGTTGSVTNPPAVAAPTLTGFLPISGARGSTVVLTGTNFTGATVVSINSAAVGSFNVDSATQITAVLNDSQASGMVRVITPGGTATSSDSFTVTVAQATNSTLDFSDNSNGFRYSPYQEQRPGFVQRSAFAQVVLKTNHTTLKIKVQNYGNGSDGSSSLNSYPQTEVGYRLNGVRQVPLRGPLGTNAYPTPSFYTHTITLPPVMAGQYHEIELTEGTTLYLDNAYGANISIVRVDATGGDALSIVPLVRRSKRVFMSLDSIGVSANNSDPSGSGIITRLREDPDLAGWEFATDGAAGAYDENRLDTDAKAQAHTTRATDWLTGASVALYFSETITNSWGNNSSPNAFFNKKTQLIDAIRTVMPTVRQLIQTAFVRVNGGNSKGYSLQAFSDIISNIVSARPQYTVRLDASQVLIPGDLRDGVHPTDAGEVKVYLQWKAWFLANASAAAGVGVPDTTYTPLGTELVVGPTTVQNNELNRRANSAYTLTYRPSIDVPASSGANSASSNADISVGYVGNPYEGEISYNINSQAMEITTQDEVFVGTGLEVYAPIYPEGAQWELLVDNRVVNSGTAQGAQTATKLMAKVYNLPDGRHTWKYRMVNYAPDRKYLMVDYIKIIR